MVVRKTDSGVDSVSDYLPYSRQRISEDDIEAVCNVLRSDFLTTGPMVERFEKAFAKKVGAKYAVAVSSGTAALHCGLRAMGLGKNDEVLVPAITFMATANAVIMAGGTPVIVDVNPGTLLMSITDAIYKAADRTKVIMPVDYAGQLCDWPEVAPVLVDACHSLGVGFWHKGMSAAYSFHAVKAITTCGEGGMFATDDKITAERARAFRNHGRGGLNDMDFGCNYRLPDVSCAMGLSQLGKLDQFVNLRQLIAFRYDEEFQNTNHVTPLAKVNAHARHLYVVKVKDRDRFRAKLAECGVGTQIHYPSLTKLPAYYNQLGSCPVAERECEKIVSLPCHPSMTNNDIERVIDAVLASA